MPRRAKGVVDERRWKDGRTISFRLRVPWRGRQVPVALGTNHEGWNHDRALAELDRIMVRVERGTWSPPEPEPEPVAGFETFHVVASRWWLAKQRELEPSSLAEYEYRLQHLLRFFGTDSVDQIGITRVDAYREHKFAEADKLREALQERQALLDAGQPVPDELDALVRDRTGRLRRPISARYVNMHLGLLAQILDWVIEREVDAAQREGRPPRLGGNPARGRGRRAKEPKRQRTWLYPDMVLDIVEAGQERDERERRDRKLGRAAMLGTMACAGLRVHELCDLRWLNVDLHHGLIRVWDRAKTAAGLREIEMTAWVQELLLEHRTMMEGLGRDVTPEGFVFGTSRGGRRDEDRLRDRVLRRAVTDANAMRRERGRVPLPDGVTPHSLRRTFITLALVAGRDPRWVMQQVGHADPKLTLSIYAQVADRRRIDGDAVWRLMRFPDEPQATLTRGRMGRSASREAPTVAA